MWRLFTKFKTVWSSLLITAYFFCRWESSYFILCAAPTGQCQSVQWHSRATPTQHPLMGEQVLDRVQWSRADLAATIYQMKRPAPTPLAWGRGTQPFIKSALVCVSARASAVQRRAQTKLMGTWGVSREAGWCGKSLRKDCWCRCSSTLRYYNPQSTECHDITEQLICAVLNLKNKPPASAQPEVGKGTVKFNPAYVQHMLFCVTVFYILYIFGVALKQNFTAH